MKIKYLFISIVSILMLISASQIFTIPPYAGDIFPIYKSGYFTELDREFKIIKDSFITIKTLSEPVYGWIFLSDIEKEYNMKIKLYNNKGYHIPAPYKVDNTIDKQVANIISSYKPEIYSEINKGKYISIIPIYTENKCRFCHKNLNEKGIRGAIKFERTYNSYIYYSSERIIIFLIITIILGVLLFVLIKWDPEKSVKELFDKI